MSKEENAPVPVSLIKSGVAIVGVGLMGAAYATRLSALGIPTTLFNRTPARATEAAATKKNVTVARTIEECVAARDILLVACSPTLEAVRGLFDPLVEKGLVKGKHVVFIVDAGMKAARYMDEVVFQRGKAASVVNVALFGTAFSVMQGTGGVMNASGRVSSREALDGSIVPLLELFGKVTFHDGGPLIASVFAMGGHIAFLPVVYSFMHYQAVMERGGVDAARSAEYFQLVSRAMLDGYLPMLQPMFEKRDYSLFFGSHRLFEEILEEAAETCSDLGVDPAFAKTMAGYHRRAIADRELAPKSFTSAYEVIAPRRK